MISTFLDQLKESVLLGDGAIGTEMISRGADISKGIESCNIVCPDIVLKLHEDYVSAGSRVIETNTFAANRISLGKRGMDSQIREVITSGVILAKRAAGSKAYVAGSVGPLPKVEGEPLGKEEQVMCFAEQVGALLDSGVDLLMFESFTNISDICLAVACARALTDLPIVAQMAFGAGAKLADGTIPSEAAKQVVSAGANVVGANCGYGFASVSEAVKAISKLGVPASAFLNAGFPEQVEHRLFYKSSPSYIAQRSVELVGRGARLVGGCCGIGPETIRLIASMLSAHFESKTQSAVVTISQTSEVSAEKPVRTAPQLPGPVIVELDPPAGVNMEQVIAAAKQAEEFGVSTISLADNPLASIRVDNLALAGIIRHHVPTQIILHMTSRDRNRIALQSTVMGAHVLGLESLLCITGDPVRMCEDTSTSGVFDVSSVGLVRLVSEFNDSIMNQGTDRPPVAIGVALNPNVRSIAGQITKLKRKIEAGANFVMTQPVFSVERYYMLRDAMVESDVDIPIYLGLLPLLSLRNAEFLHNEVPGIVVPDNIRQKMDQYTNVEDQRKAAMDIVIDLVGKLAKDVTGFYIIPQRNRIDILEPLVGETLRLVGRAQ